MEPTVEITLTLRLPLRVDDAARRLLEEVDARYTASYNCVAAHGWDANVRSSIDLHRDTYYDEKEASGLPSQLVISARMRARTAEHRRRLHGWSFDRLQTFVSYKGLRRHAHALWVDPAYTSQTCSRCGYCERANRRSQSSFRCKACSFECNADLNASRNLEQRGRAVIASGELGGPPSTGPHVSHGRKAA